jgi:hypothetical protein
LLDRFRQPEKVEDTANPDPLVVHPSSRFGYATELRHRCRLLEDREKQRFAAES